MGLEFGGESGHALPKRDLWRAMRRGLKLRCPHCGTGRLFSGYLKVRDTCHDCGEELRHQRADDAPPYFTITIVAHIVVPGLVLTERVYHLPLWVQMAIWLPATVLLSLVLLPPVKGALIGLQWANYMHGFNPHQADPDGDPVWDVALRDSGVK